MRETIEDKIEKLEGETNEMLVKETNETLVEEVNKQGGKNEQTN